MKNSNIFVMSMSLLMTLRTAAITLTTADGERLRDARCVKVNSRGLVIEHHDGVTTVKPEQLSESSRRDMAEHITAYRNYVMSRNREQARMKQLLSERQRQFDLDVAALVKQNPGDFRTAIASVREKYARLNLDRSKLDRYERDRMQKECDVRLNYLCTLGYDKIEYMRKEVAVLHDKYEKYHLDTSKVDKHIAFLQAQRRAAIAEERRREAIARAEAARRRQEEIQRGLENGTYVKVYCPHCNGRGGVDMVLGWDNCSQCHGRGWAPMSRKDFDGALSLGFNLRLYP